jgi:hypothetical protein
MRNRIINGAMVIDQRNNGASVNPASGIPTYIVDRWQAYQDSTSKFTVQQNAGSVTPPVGFTNYLGVTSSSAYTVPAGQLYQIYQSIEGFNISDLGWGTVNAKTITLSFWVRSSLTGNFGGALKNSNGTRSYPFIYTISAANTWEQKSVTIAGDTTGTWLTTNGLGLNVVFGLGVGSTFSGTAGAWAAGNFSSVTGATSVVGTNGATFYITGVQLEVGTQATSFEYRQYQQELALCQRYYETTSFPQTTFGISQVKICIVGSTTTSNANGFSFIVTKRASPTIVLYSRNNTANSASLVATGSNISGTATANNISPNGFQTTQFQNPQTAGAGIEIGYTVDSEL